MELKRLQVSVAEDCALAGDPHGAAAAVRQALDHDGEDRELWFLWAHYLASAHELEAAAAALFEALSRDPDYAMAHHLLANCLRDLGRTEQAQEHYRRAIDLLEDDAEPIADFGHLYLASGDRDLAAALFKRAIGMDPGCSVAVEGMARLEAEPGGAGVSPAADARTETETETETVAEPGGAGVSPAAEVRTETETETETVAEAEPGGAGVSPAAEVRTENEALTEIVPMADLAFGDEIWPLPPLDLGNELSLAEPPPFLHEGPPPPA